MIYFMRSGRRVKIGYAEDPYRRLKELQTGSAHKLELLGYIPGSYEQETILHRHFEPYHMRAEWFRLSKEIKLFIEHRNIASIMDIFARRLKRTPGSDTEVGDLFARYKADGGTLRPGPFALGLKAICEVIGLRFRRDDKRVFLLNVSLCAPADEKDKAA